MMSDHHDPIALKSFLKQDMIWKSLKIAPSSSTWIVMMSLGVLLDAVDRVIYLLPEFVAQLIRYLRIHRGDLAGILRCPGVDD